MKNHSLLIIILLLFSSLVFSQNQCDYSKSSNLNQKIVIITDCNISENVKKDLLKNIFKELNYKDLQALNLDEKTTLKLNELIISNLPESTKKFSSEELYKYSKVLNNKGMKEELSKVFGLYGRNSIKIEKIDNSNFIVKYNTSPYLKDTKEVKIKI